MITSIIFLNPSYAVLPLCFFLKSKKNKDRISIPQSCLVDLLSFLLYRIPGIFDSLQTQFKNEKLSSCEAKQAELSNKILQVLPLNTFVNLAIKLFTALDVCPAFVISI